MGENIKHPKETPKQENKEELRPNENEVQQEQQEDFHEAWWNAVCYSNYSGTSDR